MKYKKNKIIEKIGKIKKNKIQRQEKNKIEDNRKQQKRSKNERKTKPRWKIKEIEITIENIEKIQETG